MDKIICEICVDSVESSIRAEKAGANRLELCQALNAGGLTPSLGLYRQVRKTIDLPIMVMLRPRSGDFYYSDFEKDLIIDDLKTFKAAGAQGIVVGALKKDGSVDLDFIKEVKKEAGSMEITFHRAFDMSSDLQESIDCLAMISIDRILTSGGEGSCQEGLDKLRELLTYSDGRISLMLGAGINSSNVAEIIKTTGAKEIHFSAKKSFDSPMEYRNKRLSMGGGGKVEEYRYDYTDQEEARKIINIVRGENE